MGGTDFKAWISVMLFKLTVQIEMMYRIKGSLLKNVQSLRKVQLKEEKRE